MKNEKINLNQEEAIIFETQVISTEGGLNKENEIIISDELRNEEVNLNNSKDIMITEVNSDEIIKMSNENKIEYLEKNVFKSKFVLGRLNKIRDGKNGKYTFVDLVLASDINTNYKINGTNWRAFCDFNYVPNDVKQTLNQGDLIYFKPELNSINPHDIIKVNGTTVKKLTSYKEFLKKENIELTDVKIGGLVELEREEDIRVWATEEFYRNFGQLHDDLLTNVEEEQKKIESIMKEKEKLYKSIQDERDKADKKKKDLEKELERNKKKVDQEIKNKEDMLNNKKREVDSLVRKLEYFGFKGFKDNEEQERLLKHNLLDNTVNELFQYIKNYLKYNKKLIYSDDTIRRFLVALQSNELVILSGPSGTGKSSIVTAVAEAIGGVAKIISVKPSWTETEDLIGFYNPIEKSYISTPFLDALVEAKKNENKDKLYLICLDEMNLSHVEYYFAEFLSKLEVNKENPSIELYSKEILDEVCESIEDTIQLMSGESVEISIDSIKKWCADNSKEYTEVIIELKKKIRFIEKYPAIFDIPSNVRFVGTMNIDQTTKLISPKVIDRSFIIELLKFRAKVDDIKGEKVESKFIPADILKLNNKEELSKQSKEIIKELDLINQVLELLDCDYNSRTYSHISKYLCNLEQWEIKFDKNEVLSDLIAMKILPRMNISIKNKADEKYKKWIEFKTEGYKKYSDDVKFKISKMDKGLEEDNILSFWGVY